MQVFRKKRTVIDFENVISAMLHCEEQLDEDWRKADGYWGNVLEKSGHANSKPKRKLLYMYWKRNIDNFRDKYLEKTESMCVFKSEVRKFFYIRTF